MMYPVKDKNSKTQTLYFGFHDKMQEMHVPQSQPHTNRLHREEETEDNTTRTTAGTQEK